MTSAYSAKNNSDHPNNYLRHGQHIFINWSINREFYVGK